MASEPRGSLALRVWRDLPEGDRRRLRDLATTGQVADDPIEAVVVADLADQAVEASWRRLWGFLGGWAAVSVVLVALLLAGAVEGTWAASLLAVLTVVVVALLLWLWRIERGRQRNSALARRAELLG